MAIYWALHGFLGKPTDWDQIGCSLRAIDLYAPAFPDPSEGLEAWAKVFCHTLDPSDVNILLGYSLGGRLALHCLAEAPELFAGAIFLSTHPGLVTKKERKERQKHDDSWAAAFQKEPWELLIERWNRQPVLAGLHVHRNEVDYVRRKLSASLTGWSLSKQRDFRPLLCTTSCPILWITGEEDRRFSSLAKTVVFANPYSAKKIILNAGHRLLFEAPLEIKKAVDQFQPTSE